MVIYRCDDKDLRWNTHTAQKIYGWNIERKRGPTDPGFTTEPSKE